MEYVDIIDNQNNVLSQIPKKEAHEKGLLHRCVIAEVKNSHGEWLLVRQSVDRQDAGQFVSPVGGHVSAGEEIDHALIREAMEEIGILPKKYKEIGRDIYNRNTRSKQENHYFIVYEIYSDEIPTINEESEMFEYFSEQKIKDSLQRNSKIFGDAFLFILQKFYPQLL